MRARDSSPTFVDRLRSDLPAGVVVALVALPLCLGIAHASGVPPMAGLVTGVVGGLVVAWLSGSNLSVSGPAAGLIVLVLALAEKYGYRGVLAITVAAGAIQLLLGLLRAGNLTHLFPRPVIEGMLAAIGVILILKQIPHAIGFSGDFEGNLAFRQLDGRNSFTEIPWALGHLHLGAVTIAIVGLLIYFAMGRIDWLKRRPWIPPALIAVVVGAGLAVLFGSNAVLPTLPESLRVDLPGDGAPFAALVGLAFPDFSVLLEPAAWFAAGSIAIVASIETLLCVEAVDAMDPEGRRSPMNRELAAQGIGNMLAGSIGGIPMTSVIVRSSANVQAGGRTKLSSFAHGVVLFAMIMLAASLLEAIPLAALAAVLLVIGFRLAHPKKLKAALTKPATWFVPFYGTLFGVVFTDLLTGVLLGLVASMAMVTREAWRAGHEISREPGERPGDRHTVRVTLGAFVPFVSRGPVRQAVLDAPEGALILIDGRAVKFIDPDVVHEIRELVKRADDRKIEVKLQGASLEGARRLSTPPPPSTAPESSPSRVAVEDEVA